MTDLVIADHVGPKYVLWAVRLFWAALVLSAVPFVLYVVGVPIPIHSSQSLEMIASQFVIGLGVSALLIYMMSKGRNWARIVFLILFLFQEPLQFAVGIQHLAEFPFFWTVSIFKVLLKTSGCILIFMNPASNWFRERKQQS